ncbi:hypothetical protein [uncultured Rikenella sp.]|uniref:hypothetical protein n=1 Tax=uncultured Rikenella sp. TaxID=368003 RepID=UPI00272D0C16|nr:hypothetical protein [uncultured Rikenella sp.]
MDTIEIIQIVLVAVAILVGASWNAVGGKSKRTRKEIEPARRIERRMVSERRQEESGQWKLEQQRELERQEELKRAVARAEARPVSVSMAVSELADGGGELNRGAETLEMQREEESFVAVDLKTMIIASELLRPKYEEY